MTTRQTTLRPLQLLWAIMPIIGPIMKVQTCEPVIACLLEVGIVSAGSRMPCRAGLYSTSHKSCFIIMPRGDNRFGCIQCIVWPTAALQGVLGWYGAALLPPLRNPLRKNGQLLLFVMLTCDCICESVNSVARKLLWVEWGLEPFQDIFLKQRFWTITYL